MKLGMKLMFCMWLGLHKCLYLMQSVRLGSGDFRDCRTRGRKHVRGYCLKIILII